MWWCVAGGESTPSIPQALFFCRPFRERVLALDPRTGAALFEARLAAPASVVAGEHPASAGLVAAAAAERWPAALETAR